MVLKQSIVSTEEFKSWGLPNQIENINDDLLGKWLLQASRLIDLSMNNLVSRLDLLNPDSNIPAIVLEDIKQAVIELVNYFVDGDYAGDEQKVSQTFNSGIAGLQRDADTYGSMVDAFPIIVKTILQNSPITLYEFNPDVSPQISPTEYLKKDDANTDNIKNNSTLVSGDTTTEALDYLYNNSGTDWDYNARGNKIVNVKDPTENQDALTKAYFDWNTLELRKQTINLDVNGEIIDDRYEPDLHPKRLVSQEVLRNHSPGAPISVKDFNEVLAVNDEGTLSTGNLPRNGTTQKWTLPTSFNPFEFTKDGKTYKTDRIKITLDNIISYSYSTYATTYKKVFYYNINDLPNEVKVFKSFNLKFKDGTGNFYYARQGFSLSLAGDRLVLATVAYSGSSTEGSHIKVMDIKYELQKLNGSLGIKGQDGTDGKDGAKGEPGNTGAKGDKGDTGARGQKGDTGDKGDKGDKGDTGPAGTSASGLGSVLTNNENNLNLAHQNIQLDNLEIGDRILYKDYSDKRLAVQHIIINNTQKDIPLPNLNTWINEYDFVVAEDGKYNIKQLFYYKLLFSSDIKRFRITSGIHNTTTGVVTGQQSQDFDFTHLDNDKDIKSQVFNWYKETIATLKTGITYNFRMNIQGLDYSLGTFSPVVYTSAPHVYELSQKSHLELSELVEKGSGADLPSYDNNNYQKFTSDTYAGDIDNTLRTIEGWAEKLKNKDLFYSQSNGAFVIDETYRQEISDSGKDRYVRMDFSCGGFKARTGVYTAQVTTSGNFDFDGEIFLVKKGGDTSSNSYLGTSTNEIYSLVFRIPHTIASGDLMFIEIKSLNCGIADMRPPYHLSFTELGTKVIKGSKGTDGTDGIDGADGAKGDKGDQGIQGVKGDKGDTGPKGDKGDKGEPGTSGTPKLGKVNNIMDSINLATQNLVSNVGENLKEGGAEFFQSYQYATLPETSVVIDATERIIPFPKGLDAWENEITFTPKNISTYMFKNLFFFNLNPFTNDNKKFQIKQTLTDKDNIEYTNLIKYDLNDIEDADIQTNKFSHFSKFFESINPTKAPYTYKQTIQGLEGSTSSLLIDTETTGGDSLYPQASHMSIIEMIPSGTTFAYDKNVEISDPNDYTYYGFDPSTGSNIVAALQYAMSETQNSKLLGRVIKIGEDTDKNITKVLIDSPVDIEVNNQKITQLKDGVLDTDAVTVKQLKDSEVHLEKQSYKDVVSVDKFLLDAYSNTLSGFTRGVWKTADLGLIQTFESWVDGTQIVTDQLKVTLTNAMTGGGTLPNGKEYFIDIKNIETSDTIQNKVMDDLTHEYNEETVSIKFNLRKNATNIFLDIVSYTEGTLVGKLNSIDIEIDLIKLKGVKSVKGADGPQGAKGDKGDTGNTGATGPQGAKGDKGDTGPAGGGGTVLINITTPFNINRTTQDFTFIDQEDLSNFDYYILSIKQNYTKAIPVKTGLDFIPTLDYDDISVKISGDLSSRYYHIKKDGGNNRLSFTSNDLAQVEYIKLWGIKL